MSYSDNAANVATILGKKGQEVTLHQTTVGEYDSATSSTTESTSVDILRNGAVFDCQVSLLTGTLIQEGDKELFMEVGVVPSTSDTVTVSGIKYNIMNVEEINPAGIPVLYILRLRV